MLCTLHILSYTGDAPVAMSNIPVYDIEQDPVPDQVKMEPSYQELSFYSNVSKQKPAGNVNYYEDIINDQNVAMTKNPSYAVP